MGVVIASHGIGHTLFLMQTLGLADLDQSSRSWLLNNLLGDGPTQAIGGLLWLVATVGFIAAGVGVFGQQGWWRTLAVVGDCVQVLVGT